MEDYKIWHEKLEMMSYSTSAHSMPLFLAVLESLASETPLFHWHTIRGPLWTIVLKSRLTHLYFKIGGKDSPTICAEQVYLKNCTVLIQWPIK